MATLIRDALLQEGGHDISTINSSWAKPLVNGAIIEDGVVDNGLLVELDGYDEEGNNKCKFYEGTGQAYIAQTAEEEQLMTDFGETSYTCFYNKKGEIARLFVVESTLRQETSAYSVATGVTLAKGLPVEWDATNHKFKVVATSTTAIAKVVDLDTDFGYNAGKSTIRIQYV